MRVYITAAAGEVAMKPKAEPPQPQQQQQAAARRGCRSAVVTGLLAGVLFLRAALLAVEAGASLCPSATGKAVTSHLTVAVRLPRTVLVGTSSLLLLLLLLPIPMRNPTCHGARAGCLDWRAGLGRWLYGGGGGDAMEVSESDSDPPGSLR